MPNSEVKVIFSNIILDFEDVYVKFLMVLTATKYAYLREDGVFVIPLGCLKN